MRNAMTMLVVAALLGLAAQAAFASNPVRISQVYGAGSNSGATYNQDYVELFNSSGVAIDISGWSLQYGSSTGTVNLGACTNCMTTLPPGSVIRGCGYFLIGLNKGTVGAALPVAPDFDSSPGCPTCTNMSGSTGKIGLKADAVTTPCAPQSAFVDLVGYGTPNCSEGSPVKGAAFTTTEMAVRNGDGQTDTDSNSTDFTVVTAAVPRNGASPVHPNCIVIGVEAETWGKVKVLFH